MFHRTFWLSILALGLAAPAMARQETYRTPSGGQASIGWSRSAPASAPTTLEPAARNMLREIQIRLQRLGMLDGEPTGELDRDTRRAVGQFQRQQGMGNQVSLGEVLLKLRAIPATSQANPGFSARLRTPSPATMTPQIPAQRAVTRPAGLRQLSGQLAFQGNSCQLNGVALGNEWCEPFASQRQRSRRCDALVSRQGQVYSLKCGK